ncbi:MAG: ABC transporter permease subunit [Verrucomicrobiota bacterium]
MDGFSGILLRITTIAKNTLIESLRQRVLLVLLLFGVGLTVASFYFTQFTFEDEFRFLKDIGSASISITGLLVAMIGAAQLIPAEIERRTIYTVLSKPVGRFEFLLGKYLGLFSLLTIMLVLMSMMFACVLLVKETVEVREVMVQASSGVPSEQQLEMINDIKAQSRDEGVFQALILIWMRLALVAGIAVTLSTMATSTVFIVFTTLVIYFIGHLQATAREVWLEQGTGGVFETSLLAVVSLLIPDFQSYSIIDEILAGNSVSWNYVFEIAGYSVCYAAIILAIGGLIFKEREL